MRECEDCGDESQRRTKCSLCGKLVCGWCYNHIHGPKTDSAWRRLESLEPATARRLRAALLQDGELRRAVHAAEQRAAAGMELDDL